MPQSLLPMVPEGASRISDLISVVRENGVWTYFCGVHPVFRHPEGDRRSFRMFTAQLVCQGTCREVDILRIFGVSKNSVIRSVKKFRAEGIEGFYGARKRRGATVLTAEVTAEAQRLLSTGRSRREVAEELAIKYDTLRKAIQQGRLQELSRPAESVVASDKSQRSGEDATAEMGTACTRPVERVLAALGMLEGAPTRFEPCRDVSYGGVLCALPGLIENGLLRHLNQVFPTLTGYYTTMHVLLLLGYLALCRIKTVERLQYEPPGELGKLLGLDRVPEVRCLRQKMAELGCDDAAGKWAGLLSRDWMEASPELAGVLYVDGHVRLYHGQQTELPRRYVARQRLCLRGTTDYWVNDALGQPFFVVERPIDHGMLEVLRSDVVPCLLHDVPGQPNEEQLKQDPYRARFVLIFDREGYSPAFFKEMWEEHRIACITYHKYPKDPWPETEFVQTEITLPNGERVSLKLAERGSWIGNRHEGLWVREIRKLTTSGHQTSLISSAYRQLAAESAAALFSRWSQENFFRYMMEHFAIDALSEYGTETIPGTNKPVVNPNWRELDRQSRSLKGKLVQRQARFAAMTLHPESEEKEVSEWEKRKAKLVEELEQLEHELDQVKQRLKETPKHVLWDELPAEQKFDRLASSRKRLTDTVKMIAYRAETAMMAIVREKLARQDDARALLRDLFRSEADLVPCTSQGVLEVRVHPMANPRSNRAIVHLLTHLNETSFTYPGTNLKLVYTMPSVPVVESGPT
jgi:transposase